ncbi:unnamed protein product [Staurois parvus]|uniref:Uncharacterized protein n=1 Tax=Staurois parvus TaxID=386267 RepID=A0ABN9BHU6_9NEOB|nr:unnamed protein product [Staurois parvus]
MKWTMQPPPHITGWIQSWEPTREMSPFLCNSRDFTQEVTPIPHHHQSGNLRDPKVEVKEEIKEGVRMGGMEGVRRFQKDTKKVPGHHGGVIQLQEYDREMSPRPLYSRDSIRQEGHIWVPHHHQVGGSSYGKPHQRDVPVSVFPGFHTGRSHPCPSPS